MNETQTATGNSAGRSNDDHNDPVNAMVYETYQCSKDSGTIEVGFCFKASSDTDDRLPFDLVLGDFGPDQYDEVDLNALWAAHEWAAQAIVAAGRLRAIAATPNVRHQRSGLDQQPMSNVFAPALYEIDPATGEANGAVHPFCSIQCREAVSLGHYSGTRKAVAGVTRLDSFGVNVQCEHCGNDVGLVLAPERGLVGFYRPDPSGPKSPNVVLDVIEDKVVVFETSGIVFMIDRSEWMSRTEMEADTATIPTDPHYEPRHEGDTLREQVLNQRKLALDYADRIAPTVAQVLATHPSIAIKDQPANSAG